MTKKDNRDYKSTQDSIQETFSDVGIENKKKRSQTNFHDDQVAKCSELSSGHSEFFVKHKGNQYCTSAKNERKKISTRTKQEGDCTDGNIAKSKPYKEKANGKIQKVRSTEIEMKQFISRIYLDKQKVSPIGETRNFQFSKETRLKAKKINVIEISLKDEEQAADGLLKLSRDLVRPYGDRYNKR